MSFFRKFKRKQQKEFNYEEYSRRQKEEQEAKRKSRAKAQLLVAWQSALQEAIPTWQLWLALLIPPTWYKKLTGRIMYSLGQKTGAYANKIGTMKLPRWRISFNCFVLGIFLRVVNILLIEIVKFIHDRILTFGVITTLKEKPVEVAGKHEFQYTMIVRYFWVEICRKEITC